MAHTIAEYKPDFNSEIRTTVEVLKHNTMHVQGIDWEKFPFDDPEITRSYCCLEHERTSIRQRWVHWLKMCEQWETKDVWASNGSIYQKVVGCGMASSWPYWKPRPTVLLAGPIGTEWVDWTSLTMAEIREQEVAR